MRQDEAIELSIYSQKIRISGVDGAPEEIRTPDPQIRSLVLYPAELRARFSLASEEPKARRSRVHLRKHFQRSRKRAIATGSRGAWQGPTKRPLPGRFLKVGRECAKWGDSGLDFNSTRIESDSASPIFTCAGSFRDSRLSIFPYRLSSPRPLFAYAQQFHRPIRYNDPEGRADGAFDQMDLAAMGADQFGGNGQPQPAAARPAG